MTFLGKSLFCVSASMLAIAIYITIILGPLGTGHLMFAGIFYALAVLFAGFGYVFYRDDKQYEKAKEDKQ